MTICFGHPQWQGEIDLKLEIVIQLPTTESLSESEKETYAHLN